MNTAPRTAVVVGAGIVGAACAEALAVRGVRVHVVDGGRPGGGATAAGMGHVLVLDDSAAQLALTARSRTLWNDRRGGWPAAVEADPCGTIWVAADDEELAAVRAKHAAYAEQGIATEILDAAALYAHEPNLRRGLVGGLRIAADSVVYPPAATRALLDTVVVAGGRVDEARPVLRCGDGFVECADGSRLEADVVVCAAGLATPVLCAWPALVIRPKKGHLAITDRAPGFVRHQLVELGYLKSAHGGAAESVAFNVQPRATGQVLLGSSRQIDDADPGIDRAILARMVEHGIAFLPGLAALPVIRCWVGIRPSTDDHLPAIGPVPGAPRLWVAAGHEGLGITTSLGTAELLVQRLFQEATTLAWQAYDPARFVAAPAGEASHG